MVFTTEAFFEVTIQPPNSKCSMGSTRTQSEICTATPISLFFQISDFIYILFDTTPIMLKRTMFIPTRSDGKHNTKV